MQAGTYRIITDGPDMVSRQRKMTREVEGELQVSSVPLKRVIPRGLLNVRWPMANNQPKPSPSHASLLFALTPILALTPLLSPP